MILGFAHLTLSVEDAHAAAAELAAAGWQVRATHHAVPSAEQKWSLLSRPATRHDLMLLSGPTAVEVVAHDTGVQAVPTRLARADDGTIVIRVREPSVEGAFFVGLSFQEDAPGRLRLASRFPSWSASIRLEPDPEAPIDPPLDVKGYSCIAFYSSDPVHDCAALQARGGRMATRPFDIELGDRSMQIVMLRSPEGTLCELIKVKVHK